MRPHATLLGPRRFSSALPGLAYAPLWLGSRRARQLRFHWGMAPQAKRTPQASTD